VPKPSILSPFIVPSYDPPFLKVFFYQFELPLSSEVSTADVDVSTAVNTPLNFLIAFDNSISVINGLVSKSVDSWKTF